MSKNDAASRPVEGPRTTETTLMIASVGGATQAPTIIKT